MRRTWPDGDGKEHPGTDWAADGTFAALQYSTYSAEYFKKWGAQYNPTGEGWYDIPWMRYDFGKPGCEGIAQDREAAPEVLSVNLYSGEYDGQLVRAVVDCARHTLHTHCITDTHRHVPVFAPWCCCVLASRKPCLITLPCLF